MKEEVLQPFICPILKHRPISDMLNCILNLALKAPKLKIVKFSNSVDLDEVAHNEPPHLALHSLPSIV